MKLLKYQQYIKENLDIDLVSEFFVFLKDCDIEYSIEEEWLPNFEKYNSGNKFEMRTTEKIGEDKIFIFDHEYLFGFSLEISKTQLSKDDIDDITKNWESTIKWLEVEDYRIHWLSTDNPYSWERHFFKGRLPYDEKFYFTGWKSKKLTAKQMAELYNWSFSKSNENGDVYLKINNQFLIDNVLNRRNKYRHILSTDDICWELYDYYKVDLESMSIYSTKKVIDLLKIILDSDERSDLIWKKFKDEYSDEYIELNDLVSDVLYQELAFQQKDDIDNSWINYLKEYFDIEKVEDDNGQFIVKVKSEWFDYDGVSDYNGFEDVLYNYISSSASFDEFRPKYRNYPDINNVEIENEWLPIINRILENKK